MESYIFTMLMFIWTFGELALFVKKDYPNDPLYCGRQKTDNRRLTTDDRRLTIRFW